MDSSRLRSRPIWIAGAALACVGHAMLSPGGAAPFAKISATSGGFTGTLESGGRFGVSVSALGDLDGNGTEDLAVGKEADGDGGGNRGAAYVLFLNADGTVASHQKISSTEGGFGGVLDDEDRFGAAVEALGDLDGAGPSALTLAVGAIFDDDGGATRDADRGAVWLLFLDPDGTVASHAKVSATQGGFGGTLDDGDWFGVSVSSLGDLDGAGPSERAIAVGALFDDDGGASGDANRGAVWILFLDANGSVLSHTKISDTAGGFTGSLDDGDRFGRKVAALGDLDGDGVPDLAVGAPGDDDGGVSPAADRGAVWILFLNPDGTVASHRKISALAGGFTGALDDLDLFGRSVGLVGDLEGDGTLELAVGAALDDDGGANCGAVWLLSLDATGAVVSNPKLSDTSGALAGALDDADGLGVSIASLPGPGALPFVIAAGAMGDDDGLPDSGAVWLLAPVPPATTYCTAKTTSVAGCLPAIHATGTPSASASTGFTLASGPVPGGNLGIFFYGHSGSTPAAATAFGDLCIDTSVASFRTTTLQGGGTAGTCSGNLTLDWNAYAQMPSTIQSDPLATVPGTTVDGQFWYRDPPNPGAANLTDAIRFVVGP